MTSRFTLTTRLWLATAAASMLYLRPANLDFCTAHALPPGITKYDVQAVEREFKHRFAKGGHVDFGHPTVASTGVPGLYTAGLVKAGPWLSDKLKPVFEYDAALDWRDSVTPTTENVQALDFPVTGNVGFAVASTAASGSVLKSVDRGRTWVTMFSDAVILRGIGMVDNDTGWAVGHSGGVGKTTDGGASWVPQFTDGASTHFDVAAVDASTAYIAANLGVIFKTVDGGANWTVISNAVTGTTNNLLGIEFLDAMTGWAVGNAGTVIRTTDGGATWSVSFPAAVHLRGIHAKDANTLWVAGNAGTILKSVDGGSTWTPQVSGTAVALNGIAFSTDGLAGFAVGNTGVMRQTFNGGTTWTATPKIGGAANLNDVAMARDAVWHADNWFAAVHGGLIKYHIAQGQQVTTEWLHVNGSAQSLEMFDQTAGDVAGADGVPHTGLTSTLDNFEEWFYDVLGKNTSDIINMEFNKVGSGASAYFVFDASVTPFTPGYLFTVDGAWDFTYDKTAGQWLTVRANADTWVVINDKLVIDMGGIHASTSQHVDFDRLGLADGTKNRMKLFVAYREWDMPTPPPAHDLRIATNVYLTTPGLPTITDARD